MPIKLFRTDFVEVNVEANENDVDGDIFTEFEKAVRMDSKKVNGKENAAFEFTLGKDIKDGSYYFFAAQSGAQSEANYSKSALITITSLTTIETVVLPEINGTTSENAAEVAYEQLAETLGFKEESCPAWKNAYSDQDAYEDIAGGYETFDDEIPF